MKDDYYQRLVNKSPNRLEALDLFLLLDNENDQFLKYVEVQMMWKYISKFEEKDKGQIKSEEDLKEIFESFGKFQMERTTFNQFADKAEFNVGKVRDKLY